MPEAALALPAGLPPVRQRLALSDRCTALLAASVAVGAWWARPLAGTAVLGVVVGSVLLARVGRQPALLCIGACVAASWLAVRAEAGLRGAPVGPVHGVVTLLDDPTDVPGGVEVDVRMGRRHLRARATGAAARSLAIKLAGERVEVRGRARPLGARSGYLRARHVAGRLTIDTVERSLPAGLPWRSANAVHRWIVGSARWLAADQRALYTGFLLGDARGQPPEIAADMQAAGLGHLLVVSGENVAFLLALAGPGLRRLGVRRRWAGVVVLVVGFGYLTRFEPSVLRAIVMAALGAVAVSAGRRATGVRLLALSVAGLVLIDPLLVHQVGFALSVSATAGICLLARPLAAALPGPRSFARAVAVTASSQIGVAPIAAVVFGGLPVAALPANVVAEPAAAAVLVWGLPAGLLAQLLDGLPAQLLHWPTGVLVSWIAGVARVAASMPLGELGPGELVVLAACAVAAAWSHHRSLAADPLRPGGGWRRARRLALAASLVPLALPAWRVAHPPLRTPIAGGVVWRSRGATILELGGGRTASLLDDLHRLGVRRLDVVVSPSGGIGSATTVALLRRRWSIGTVLAPPGHEIRDARAGMDGDVWRLAGLDIAVVADHPRLVARITAPAARPP